MDNSNNPYGNGPKTSEGANQSGFREANSGASFTPQQAGESSSLVQQREASYAAEQRRLEEQRRQNNG